MIVVNHAKKDRTLDKNRQECIINQMMKRVMKLHVILKI